MSDLADAARSRITRLLVAVAAVAGLTLVPVQAVTANYSAGWDHADGPGETCSDGCPGRQIYSICCIEPIG